MTSKTIVITGASGGIGAAAALRLSRNGDKVVVVGRSKSTTASSPTYLGCEPWQTKSLPESCAIARWPGSLNE